MLLLCAWAELNVLFLLIPSWKSGRRRRRRIFTRRLTDCCNKSLCRSREVMERTVMMPKLGMTMEEGTVLNWFYKEGDWVEKDEALVEVMTDKVNLEVEAPFTGRLIHILAQEGDVLPVGAPIATVSDGKAEAAPAPITTGTSIEHKIQRESAGPAPSTGTVTQTG